jgi:hypothetical protein
MLDRFPEGIENHTSISQTLIFSLLALTSNDPTITEPSGRTCLLNSLSSLALSYTNVAISHTQATGVSIIYCQRFNLFSSIIL